MRPSCCPSVLMSLTRVLCEGFTGFAACAKGIWPAVSRADLLLCLQAQPRVAQQKLTLRLQRPTVVAEVSFMLAVTKFFVPGFAMSGVTPIPFTTSDLLLQGGVTGSLLCWWLNRVCCRSWAA